MSASGERRGGLRCRPDDLAIVTKCARRERLGLIVKVIGPAANGKHDWHTELQGGGIQAMDVHTGTVKRCTEALMHDWNLTPIRGVSYQYQTDQAEDLTRPACFPESA